MTLITFLPHTPFKKKNVLTFLIGTVISMGKGKKRIFLLTQRKSTFSFIVNKLLLTEFSRKNFHVPRIMKLKVQSTRLKGL